MWLTVSFLSLPLVAMGWPLAYTHWRIQRSSGGSLETPSWPTIFKYPMKMKQFGLSETKLFHFHGTFMKNEISAKRTPHLYIYAPPFQKSWIRPWHLWHFLIILTCLFLPCYHKISQWADKNLLAKLMLASKLTIYSTPLF